MTLTLKYSGDQQYQLDAIAATIDLFRDQRFSTSSFTVEESTSSAVYDAMQLELPMPGLTPNVQQGALNLNESPTIGYANHVRISDLDLLHNLHAVQAANNLPPTEARTDGRLRDFSIEMETGTGKTYVYIRTIYELNKRYGLTKFIIVVPSVAIREGVRKTFETTRKHFKDLYDSQPLDYFVYDAKNMGNVSSFATSASIEVMIINIGAFNKAFESDGDEDKSNIFHRVSEKLAGGRSPREMVAECNPIVIIDEPQSVDNTTKAKKAIESLNPLFVLRYSATLKESYNKIYELTPVDAFQQHLVKGICVDSVLAEENLNGAYVKLDSVKSEPSYSAKMTIDVLQKDGSQKRKTVTVKTGTDLYEASKENPDYRDGWIVSNIDAEEGFESVTFSNDEYFEVGQVKGDVSVALVKRAQIRRTIENHFQKQVEMQPQGVKVLSLFFIDEVAKYREYLDADSSGDTVVEDGEYAKMFDEEYRKLVTSEKWKRRFAKCGITPPEDPHMVRTGYFAQDRKTKRIKNSSGSAGTEADTDTFELIMRDKETLLSLPDESNPSTLYSFIFSHSALKEGWDNPNVFQICTLVETKDTMTKRQKIGRGLRLCVNQDGVRLHDPEANTLTVIANESYIDFANGLQKEFTKAGYRFGALAPESFTNLDMAQGAAAVPQPLGFEKSRALYKYLETSKLINKQGKVLPELKQRVEQHTLELPEEFEPVRQGIEEIILQRAANLTVKNKQEEVTIEIRDEALYSDAFQELWQRIRQRSTYRLNVDEEKLITESVKWIQRMEEITPPKVRSVRADLNIDMAGVSTDDERESLMNMSDSLQYKLPDPISALQDIVGLTRASLKRILEDSGRLDEYPIDPSAFITQVAYAISVAKTNVLAEGISYTLLPEDEWYTEQILIPHNRKGYLEQNAFQPSHIQKWLYDYVVYDSTTIEKPYALELDKVEQILVCTKLPPTFTIDTPFGPYNPDWAYVREEDDGTKRLYLVVETKGGQKGQTNTRDPERAKIDCATMHFKQITAEYPDFEYKPQSQFK